MSTPLELLPPGPAGQAFAIVAGILLLVAGRRLFWLLVGVAGFVAGFSLAVLYLDTEPAWLHLVVAAALGLAAGFLAVLVQKLVIALTGFLLGAAGLLWVTGNLPGDLHGWLWLVAIVGGIAGTALVVWGFELGLVILSAGAGAWLLVTAAGATGTLALLGFLLLGLLGATVQLRYRGRRRPRIPRTAPGSARPRARPTD